jgi:hypothetical protein
MEAPCYFPTALHTRFAAVDSLFAGGLYLRTKLLALSVALLCLSLAAIAGPKLELKWKNPDYAGGGFKNILVLALNGKAANRAQFEDELVAAISRPTIQAFPSYEFMPRPDATPIDKRDLRELIKEQKFDAIVVARLVKREKRTTYVPGEIYTPFPYYGSFYGYYDTLAPVIYTPGYMQTEKVAQVEVNFYSTDKPDGDLVWTGTTNVFDAGSAMKSINGLVKVLTNELEKENIIPKKSK